MIIAFLLVALLSTDLVAVKILGSLITLPPRLCEFLLLLQNPTQLSLSAKKNSKGFFNSEHGCARLDLKL